MLTEEQQSVEVNNVTASSVIVALQCVSRLISVNAIKPVELAPIGLARDALVKALEEATGVNFDIESARRDAEQRQRLAAARQAQSDGAAAPAAAEESSEESAEASVPAEEPVVEESAAEPSDEDATVTGS